MSNINLKAKNEASLKKAGMQFEFIPLPEDLAIDVESHVRFHGIEMKEAIPTLIYKTEKGLIAVQRRADTKISLEKVKELVGVKQLVFAQKEDLYSLGVETGYVPLMGLEIPYFTDKKVLEVKTIYGGSGAKLSALKMSSADLVRINKSVVGDFTESAYEVNGRKKRILTGDTPTGKLHIGHYVGTLENRIKLQNTYDTYIILANIHARANYYEESDRINENVYEVFLDNLAAGIDPKVATIFLESGIPELYELYGLFLTMVKHSRVIRNPSVKEEIIYKKLDPSVAFIVYPILQAADILGFNADLVPVGEDQLPVIEQTREIARDFNKAFGETFVLPEAKVGRVARLVGTDGKLKMSKSGSNAILLSDDEKILKQKIMSMYTDPARIHPTDPGKVEGNPVFSYHDAFNPYKAEVEDLKNRYKIGKVGDIEVKQKLFVALNSFLEPIREKRKYYEGHPKEAKEILIEGTNRARKTVVEVMEKVREKTKINKLIE